MNRWTILLIAALATGCGGAEEPAAAETEAPATEVAEAEASQPAATESAADPLIELAKAIRANPGNTEALLSEAGMTVEAFEAAMFELASDPEKARAFAQAVQ